MAAGKAPPSAGPSSQAAPTTRPASAAASSFDTTQPPLSLVAALPDDSLAGLPDVQIYGMRVKAKYIAATAAATVFLGLRGLLVGAIIAMYLLSNPEGGAARPTSSAGPSRSRPGAAAAAPTGPPSFTRRNPNAPPPAAAAAPKKDSFGGGARGHKLGSSKEG